MFGLGEDAVRTSGAQRVGTNDDGHRQAMTGDRDLLTGKHSIEDLRQHGSRLADAHGRHERDCTSLYNVVHADAVPVRTGWLNEPPRETATVGARQLRRWELDGVTGPVVVVDVLRAFTTAAYAFAAGAQSIHLVASVAEALEFKRLRPDALAIGEAHGRIPDGFDLPNSPVAVCNADVTGRVLVQRTSAGTQGVIAAQHADRLWAASLVCASATAAAVAAAGLGDPTYVITGCFEDAPHTTGHDDRLAAEVIEAARLGRPPARSSIVEALFDTLESRQTQALSTEGTHHADPLDVAYAAEVDRFHFAMEVVRDQRSCWLEPRPAPPIP